MKKPNRQLLPADLEKIKAEFARSTLADLADRYAVSKTTMGDYLRKYGVLPQYDGWLPNRYDRLLTLLCTQPVPKIATAMEASVGEIMERISLLGVNLRTRGLTLPQTAIVTGIGRLYWSRYIGEGLVTTSKVGRSRRIQAGELLRAVIQTPEIFPYDEVPQVLLDMLGWSNPGRPTFKLVTCRSTLVDSSEVRVTLKGGHEFQFIVKSCAHLDGVDFWVPINAVPTCPRCGARTSRFSEKKQYGHKGGDSQALKNAMASKIGLGWANGTFCDPEGNPMDPASVSLYVSQISRKDKRKLARNRSLVTDIARL